MTPEERAEAALACGSFTRRELLMRIADAVRVAQNDAIQRVLNRLGQMTAQELATGAAFSLEARQLCLARDNIMEAVRALKNSPG